MYFWEKTKLYYFAATLLIFGLAVAGMALGVIFSNKPIKGSCGGLKPVTGEDCAICGNREKCKKVQSRTPSIRHD